MKKTMIFLALIGNAIFIDAQNAQMETEIKKLEETEREAMLKQDTARLQKIWDQDLFVNTPFNRITSSSKELLDLVNAGVISFSSFTRDIEKIFIKGNVAISMGTETVIPIGNNPKAGQTIKRRYTNIWMKQNGTWRLTARHANEICVQ